MFRQDGVDSLRSKHIEAYSNPCEASRLECFEKISTLTIFNKTSTLDVRQHSEYALSSIRVRVLNMLNIRKYPR